MLAVWHGTGGAASSRLLRPWGIANYLLMCVLLVLFVYPFWDVLVLSFTTPRTPCTSGFDWWRFR